MKHVVVTTDESRRGVFSGQLETNDGAGNVILLNARMCIYWSRETRGVLGLAATGPAKGSRVSPAVPRIVLNGVTSIMDMTEQAIQAWEEEPWN